MSALFCLGKAASVWAITGTSAWVKSAMVLVVAEIVSRSGGGIVRGEEQSA